MSATEPGATGAGATASATAASATTASATAADVAVVVRVRRRGAGRVWVVSGGLGLAVLAAFLLTMVVGDHAIPLPDLIASLTGHGSKGVDFIVHRLRLPRAVLAVLAGVAFGLSGAIFQRVVRNPLASPDVIGVTSGASVAAVLGITVGGLSGLSLSAAALGGSVLSTAAIYALAWRRGISGYRLALIGVGVAAGLSGVVSYLMTRADIRVATEALLWLTGSLNGRGHQVGPLGLALVVLVPAALALGRTLYGLQLGDDTARGLGLNVERGRIALLLTGVALVGAATAAVGPVAFVAFVSGPIALRLTGGGRPDLLPAGLVGALVVLLSDFAAQHALGGTQLPVGVVTGVVGAPYLLWLLVVSNRTGRGG
ncbi:iron chelate uptake ABC transporter family permease subunit [Nonomuraea sp. NPDC050404]|uniref:FecCD family ABC transporter permease n=1 Tax=Nonomuraea sp. NPDC050404 TaxID=3155783 RepID=UPI00340B388F